MHLALMLVGIVAVVLVVAGLSSRLDLPSPLVLIAFTVTAGTLFLQGLSLPWLARRLKVPAPYLREPQDTVEPDTPGECGDCLREGTAWVHLRMCVTCGHVGCCDSSPQRRASAHHERTGHPVMRSAEPGEYWRWCFVDEVTG